MKLSIYTDGGARGNPGPAAIGLIIKDKTKEILTYKKKIGSTTNNVAEYIAIKTALKKLLQLKIEVTEVRCFLDSELVVKQLLGVYKIKKPHLKTHKEDIDKILKLLKKKGDVKISFHHIMRSKNKHADKLVNEAFDE